MSSPTLDQIQSAIKHALETIDGIRAFATEPDQMPGSTVAIVYPRPVDWSYDQDFEYACDDLPMQWHLDIWVVVVLSGGINRAQTALNPFLSPVGRKSVKAALERDVSLGGTVYSTRVTGGGAYGTTDVAGVHCLAASVRTEIFA